MHSHAAARESRTERNEGIAWPSRLDDEIRLGVKARRNCLFFSSACSERCGTTDGGRRQREEVEEARGGQMEEEEEEGRMEMEKLV